ncbi:MAG: DNA-3-methyladenine glycosylase [Limnochordaceae bacterium]|nr:DNA-3-methyladenine glycosylase [Limnochordaceae bacterium]
MTASSTPLPRLFYARSALELARALIGCVLVHRVVPVAPRSGQGASQEGRSSALRHRPPADQSDERVELRGRIVETEAYMGPEDRAAHSYGGRRTARNEVMYGPAGVAYVYFIYGMYYCFNIVAASPGVPQAVLIRALEPLSGLEEMAARRGLSWPLPPSDSKAGLRARRLLTSGPGRLCQAMGITREHNGLDLTTSELFCVSETPAIGRSADGSGGVPAARLDIKAAPRINVAYAGPEWASLPWRFYLKDSPYVSVMSNTDRKFPSS